VTATVAGGLAARREGIGYAHAVMVRESGDCLNGRERRDTIA
jgi:hypothetical protein